MSPINQLWLCSVMVVLIAAQDNIFADLNLCKSSTVYPLCAGWEALLPVPRPVRINVTLQEEETTSSLYFNRSVASPLCVLERRTLGFFDRAMCVDAILASLLLELSSRHIELESKTLGAFHDGLLCQLLVLCTTSEDESKSPMTFFVNATMQLRHDSPAPLLLLRAPSAAASSMPLRISAPSLCVDHVWCRGNGAATAGVNNSCVCSCYETVDLSPSSLSARCAILNGSASSLGNVTDWSPTAVRALPVAFDFDNDDASNATFLLRGQGSNEYTSRQRGRSGAYLVFDSSAVNESRPSSRRADDGEVRDAFQNSLEAVIFEGEPPRSLPPHAAALGVRFNGSISPSSLRGVQMSGIARGAIDFGPLVRSREKTITFWMRAEKSVSGFVYLLTDNWMTAQFDAPLASEALRILSATRERTSGSHVTALPSAFAPISEGGAGYRLTSGLFLDSATAELTLFFQSGMSSDASGQTSAALHTIRFIKPRLFDGAWHFVALGFTKEEGRRLVHLYIDGDTSFVVNDGWRGCFPRGDEQTLESAQELVRGDRRLVPNAINDVVFDGGALHMGYVDAGRGGSLSLFDLRVHDLFLSQQEVILQGAAPMDANIFIMTHESLALGIALALAAAVTIGTMIHFFYSDIFSESSGDNDGEVEALKSMMMQQRIIQQTKKKAKRIVGFRQSAARRSGQANSLQQLATLLPMAIAPAQALTLYFRGLNFPVQFASPLSVALFVFSIDPNLMFPSLGFQVTPLIQFTIVLLAVAIFLLISLLDNGAFRKKVIDGERLRQVAESHAAQVAEGLATQDDAVEGTDAPSGAASHAPTSPSSGASPARGEALPPTQPARDESIPSPHLYPEGRNEYTFVSDSGGHSVVLAPEGNSMLQHAIDTILSRGAVSTPTPVAFPLEVEATGGHETQPLNRKFVTVRNITLFDAAEAERLTNRRVGIVHWSIGAAVALEKADQLQIGTIVISTDTHVCPLHKQGLISIVEGVHTLVPLRSDGSEPYTCAFENNAVFRRVRGPSCDTQTMVVCPVNDCGYATCCACYGGLGPRSAALVAARTKLWSLKNAEVREILGNITIIVAQALYVPSVMTALMILSCHPTYACHLGLNCYNYFGGDFAALVIVAALVLVLEGLVFGMVMTALLVRRKVMIVDSGLWAHAIGPPPSIVEVLCCCIPCLSPGESASSAAEGNKQPPNNEEADANLAGEEPPLYVPTKFWEKVMCTMDEQSWRDIIESDNSVCRMLYENIEFGYMCIAPIYLAFKFLIVAAVVLLPSASLSQLATTSALEVAQLFFISSTNAMLDAWLDLLARGGSLHSVLSLSFLSFHRVMTVDDPRAIGLVYGMFTVSIMYLVIVAVVLSFDVILPHLRSTRKQEEERERLRQERLAERAEALRLKQEANLQGYVETALASGVFESAKLRQSLYARSELRVGQAMVKPMREVLALLATYAPPSPSSIAEQPRRGSEVGQHDSELGGDEARRVTSTEDEADASAPPAPPTPPPPPPVVLTRVDLTACISPELGTDLARVISENSVITTLIISRNQFTLDGLKELSDALRINTALVRVEMQGCLDALRKAGPKLSPPATAKFTSFLSKNRTIRHLDLSAQQGFKGLFAALAKTPSISVHVLLLDDCWCPPNAVSNPASQTTVITEFATSVAGILSQAAELEEFSIAGNFIGDVGAATICAALLKLPSCKIHTLRLAKGYITNVEPLCDLLRKNRSITNLVVSGNPLDLKMLKKLVHTAVQSPVLGSLEAASCTKLSMRDEQELVKALDGCASLRTLVLHESQLQEAVSALEFVHNGALTVPAGVRVDFGPVQDMRLVAIACAGSNEITGATFGRSIAVGAWESLHTLRIPKFAELDVVVRAIVRNAKLLTKLATVDFSDAICQPTTIETFLERFVFVHMKQVTSLNISGTVLSAAAIKTLADLLDDDECALRHLDISNCPYSGRGDAGTFIGQKPVFKEDLVPALARNGSLDSLRLGGNFISKDALDEFASRLVLTNGSGSQVGDGASASSFTSSFAGGGLAASSTASTRSAPAANASIHGKRKGAGFTATTAAGAAPPTVGAGGQGINRRTVSAVAFTSDTGVAPTAAASDAINNSSSTASAPTDAAAAPPGDAAADSASEFGVFERTVNDVTSAAGASGSESEQSALDPSPDGQQQQQHASVAPVQPQRRGSTTTTAAPRPAGGRRTSQDAAALGAVITTVTMPPAATASMSKKGSASASGAAAAVFSATSMSSTASSAPSGAPSRLAIRLMELDLTETAVTAKSLLGLVRNLPALRVLRVSTIDGSLTIGELLSRAPLLRELIVNDSEVALLTPERLISSSLRVLDLSSCKLSDATVGCISAAIASPQCRLEVLQLRHCPAHATAILRAALHSPHLRDVDVRSATSLKSVASNVVGAASASKDAAAAAAVAPAGDSQPPAIADGSTPIISAADETTAPHLSTVALSLGSSRDQGVSAAEAVLRHLHSLRHLRIREVLDATERRRMANALLSNVTLEELTEGDLRPEQDRHQSLFGELGERNRLLTQFVADYVDALTEAGIELGSADGAQREHQQQPSTNPLAPPPAVGDVVVVDIDAEPAFEDVVPAPNAPTAATCDDPGNTSGKTSAIKAARAFRSAVISFLAQCAEAAGGATETALAAEAAAAVMIEGSAGDGEVTSLDATTSAGIDGGSDNPPQRMAASVSPQPGATAAVTDSKEAPPVAAPPAPVTMIPAPPPSAEREAGFSTLDFIAALYKRRSEAQRARELEQLQQQQRLTTV